MIKARIRSFEDMSPQSKCCQKSIRAMTPFHGKMVNLPNLILSPGKDQCPWCKTIRAELAFHYINEQGRGCILFPDQIDLDEGSLINV